jgi:FkbM family methyltransferase
VTRILRRLLHVRPINEAITTSVRTLLRMVGARQDFARRKLRRYGHVQESLPNGRVLRLWTEDDDLIPNEVFWLGALNFERGTMGRFLDLASRSRLTLDIGAHVGLFSLLAGHVNPSGQVIAFEPHQPSFERLRRNVALNQLSNVESVRSAVADFEGEADFFTNTALPLCGEASLQREHVAQFERFTRNSAIQKVTVPVLSLDGFLDSRNLRGVQLVKIDAEGSEPAVLRGMLKSLERDRPQIVCEVVRGFQTEAAVEELLRPLGYSFFLLTPDGLEQQASIRAQPQDRWELRNYLFAPTAFAEGGAKEMSDA